MQKHIGKDTGNAKQIVENCRKGMNRHEKNKKMQKKSRNIQEKGMRNA